MYSQPGCWNPILDLFDVLNLMVSSSLRSGQWLQCCKHKHLQFSEFEILWQLHSPPLICFNHLQPGLWNPVLHLFNALNLIVPSSLPSGQWLPCCKNKHLQFSEFEILADCSWSISKVVNVAVARSQIPKIGDVCACSTAITENMAKWMVRWCSAH